MLRWSPGSSAFIEVSFFSTNVQPINISNHTKTFKLPVTLKFNLDVSSQSRSLLSSEKNLWFDSVLTVASTGTRTFPSDVWGSQRTFEKVSGKTNVSKKIRASGQHTIVSPEERIVTSGINIADISRSIAIVRDTLEDSD